MFWTQSLLQQYSKKLKDGNRSQEDQAKINVLVSLSPGYLTFELDSKMEQYRMPHGIDEMEKFMFWDIDIIGVFMTMVGLGIFMNSFLICLIFAVILCRFISRVKYGKPEGFTFHLLYWFGAARYLGLPESYIREFIE